MRKTLSLLLSAAAIALTGSAQTFSLNPTGRLNASDLATPQCQVTFGEKPVVAEAGTNKLTVKLVYDPTKLSPQYCGAFNTPAKTRIVNAIAKQKEVVLDVAEGTYDVWVRFCTYSPEAPDYSQVSFYDPHVFVIKESVEIKGDTEVTLDAATAKNLVKFEPVDVDGQKYRYPVVKIDQSGKGYVDYDGCNVYNEMIGNGIGNSDFGFMVGMNTSSVHKTENGLCVSNSMDFYVNDVSDRFYFTQSRIAVRLNGELMILSMTNQGVPDKVITNAGNGFEKYVEQIKKSPLYNRFTREQFKSGIDTYSTANGVQILSSQFQSADEYPTAYLSYVSNMGRKDPLSQLLNPRLIEYDKVNANETHTQISTHGCPLSLTTDSMTYVGYFNPYLKFDRKSYTGGMGANNPAITLVMHNVTSDGKNEMRYVPTLVGRFSERRESDLQVLQARITLDGKEVYKGDYAGLSQFATNFGKDSHTQGKVEATFTSANVELPGGQKAETTVTVGYDEKASDKCAPALQMLSFFDKNGRCTDNFLPGETIEVAVAGADANGNGRSVITRDVKEIKVEFAPNGQNSFSEVKTEMTAPTRSSSIWAVYTGKISGLDKEGWYDMRVTLTDYDGNQSVQTVSPAFVVSKDAGVTAVGDEKNSAVYADGMLYVSEGHAVIYSIDGRAMMTAGEGATDISSLPSGIYIVRTQKGAFKILK